MPAFTSQAFTRWHLGRLSLHTSNCSLLRYLPRKDERLSRPGWLTYSRRFTHISGHPSAARRSQDRESLLLKNQRSTTTVPRNKDVHQYTAINMSCVNHGTDRWGTCVCRYQFQRRPRCQRDRSLCVPDPRRSACRATHQQTLSSVAQDGVTADARSCCHSKPMGLLAPITTSWDYLHLQVHHGDYLHLQVHHWITCT